ncbi:hypothetical protein TNCV_1724961 [Trichonephila clavipes]|nr:hypothetical protein TNCV_1724961 [Trichonephila clavipes]
MDTLWKSHHAANGIEWFEQTPNDAKHTEFIALWFVMLLRYPSMLCAQSTIYNGQWCKEASVVVPGLFVQHPVMRYLYHSYLVSSNTMTDFSEE